MAYKEVTSTSWGSRLGKSLSGICIGFLLIAVGTGLLWWNEGNFVRTGDALTEAQGVTQSLGDLNTVNAGLSGKLVHAVGLATTKDVLTDPVFKISAPAIRLKRTVEFFQWTEQSKSEKKKKLGGGEETVTTYTYSQRWTQSPVNSSSFHDPDARTSKANTVLMPLENTRLQAENVTFGAYRLPSFLVNSMDDFTALEATIPADVRENLNKQLSPPAAATPPAPPAQPVQAMPGLPIPSSWTTPQAPPAPPAPPEKIHASGSTVYIGVAPATPAVGDVRVTFSEVRPATVSIMAKLNGGTFEQFIASNGNNVSMLRVGEHSIENMYGAAHSSNETITWILRAVGALLVIIGIRLVLGPIAVVADVVPLFGSLVGAGVGLVSGLVGAAWSLLIVAVAWLRFRPIVGGVMVAVAVGLIAIAMLKGRTAKKA